MTASKEYDRIIAEAQKTLFKVFFMLYFQLS